ncbi:MAG TPA: hypothetical protein VFI22_08905, partial [Thermomicrobiales bacterium]|nr:hypothetical protein [Thermomicrobiales bacterium]
YGRMSIDPTSLDLSPPNVALQSIHALQALLSYPMTLLFFFALAWVFATPARWLRTIYDRARRRFGRFVLLVANLLIVAPLVTPAIQAFIDLGTLLEGSVASEVAALLMTVALLLVGYLVWLSFGRRALILTQLRDRRLIPIALVFAAYLASALLMTARDGERAAELLMAGISERSLAIDVTPRAGVTLPLPATPLIFVIARNDTYYVVERQPMPPSARPVAYAIPIEQIAAARLRRINGGGAIFDAPGFEGAVASPRSASTSQP